MSKAIVFNSKSEHVLQNQRWYSSMVENSGMKSDRPGIKAQLHTYNLLSLSMSHYLEP
jgi:hypothetical protein